MSVWNTDFQVCVATRLPAWCLFSAKGATFITAWGSAPGTLILTSVSAESAIHIALAPAGRSASYRCKGCSDERYVPD
jgi:hypothetical protein